MGILATIQSKHYDYYFGRESFYEKFIAAESKKGLLGLCDDKRRAAIRTARNIECGFMPFGISIQSSIKMNGRPSFRRRIKKEDLDILVFRKKQGAIKFTQVLYFINDRLLAGQLILSKKSNAYVREMLNSIELKYFGTILNGASSYNIKDKEGNRMTSKQTFHFEITYLSHELQHPITEAQVPHGVLRIV